MCVHVCKVECVYMSVDVCGCKGVYKVCLEWGRGLYKSLYKCSHLSPYVDYRCGSDTLQFFSTSSALALLATAFVSSSLVPLQWVLLVKEYSCVAVKKMVQTHCHCLLQIHQSFGVAIKSIKGINTVQYNYNKNYLYS